MLQGEGWENSSGLPCGGWAEVWRPRRVPTLGGDGEDRQGHRMRRTPSPHRACALRPIHPLQRRPGAGGGAGSPELRAPASSASGPGLHRDGGQWRGGRPGAGEQRLPHRSVEGDTQRLHRHARGHAHTCTHACLTQSLTPAPALLLPGPGVTAGRGSVGGPRGVPHAKRAAAGGGEGPRTESTRKAAGLRQRQRGGRDRGRQTGKPNQSSAFQEHLAKEETETWPQFSVESDGLADGRSGLREPNPEFKPETQRPRKGQCKGVADEPAALGEGAGLRQTSSTRAARPADPNKGTLVPAKEGTPPWSGAHRVGVTESGSQSWATESGCRVQEADAHKTGKRF